MNATEPKTAYEINAAYTDLMGQIVAMQMRSWQYKVEEESEGRIDEADKHMRAFCILKELHRLGVAFKDRAEGK